MTEEVQGELMTRKPVEVNDADIQFVQCDNSFDEEEMMASADTDTDAAVRRLVASCVHGEVNPLETKRHASSNSSFTLGQLQMCSKIHS